MKLVQAISEEKKLVKKANESDEVKIKEMKEDFFPFRIGSVFLFFFVCLFILIFKNCVCVHVYVTYAHAYTLN